MAETNWKFFLHMLGFSCRQSQDVLYLDILLVVLKVLMQPNLVLSGSTALEYFIHLLFPKAPHSQLQRVHSHFPKLY